MFRGANKKSGEDTAPLMQHAMVSYRCDCRPDPFLSQSTFSALYLPLMFWLKNLPLLSAFMKSI